MEYSSGAVNLYQHKVRRDKLKQIGFVMIEDWMIKSPPQHKLENRKLWHRRYFVLIQINTSTQRLPKSWAKKQQTSTTTDGNATLTPAVKSINEFYLAYWQNQADRNLGVKPIRIISMENGFSVAKELPPYFEEKFKFVIALDTIERKYFFCTRDELTMTSWYEFLSHAIDAVKIEAQAIKQGAMPVYEAVRDVVPEKDHESEENRFSFSSSHGPSQPLFFHDIDEDLSLHGDLLNGMRKPRSRTFDEEYTPGSIPNLFRHNSDGSRHRGFNLNQSTRLESLEHEYLVPQPRDPVDTYDRLFETPENSRRRRDEYDKRRAQECDILQHHIDSLNSLCIPHHQRARRRSVSPRMHPRATPRSPCTTARATLTPRSANCSPFMSRRDTSVSLGSSPRLVRRGTGGVDKMTIYFHDLTFEMPATSSVELHNESLHVTTDECDCYVSMLPLEDDDEDDDEEEREEEEEERDEEEDDVDDEEDEEREKNTDAVFKKEVYI